MTNRIFLALTIFSLSFTFSRFSSALTPPPPSIAAGAYILIDADTGAVLAEHNADEQMPPASLTKMMTSYIVSAEVAEGRISEDDMVPISVRAWRKGGSKMFVREGTRVLLKDLQRGVIIQSGNDASIALAEYIAGSEDAFVGIMNRKAAEMGLTNTHFVNSTGWPAPEHLTTARDQAILARRVINDFPRHYSLYAEKNFTYNGITQPNRNRLLFRDETVDGLKTGHTEEAGYCLVASAKRDGMRLISVVMNTSGEEARAIETQKLLAYGFRHFQSLVVQNPEDILLTDRVWFGKRKELAMGVAENVKLTIPVGTEAQLERKMSLNGLLKAPVEVGDQLGELIIELNGEVLTRVPLIAQHAVERSGFFSRLIDRLRLFFAGIGS